MRKIIILAVAVMALTMAVAGTASAAVDVDDSGNGFVGKGDVQTALGGINDAAMQSAWDAGTVKFTSQFKTVKDTSWTCSDGSEHHHYFTTTTLRPYNVTANTNKAGKLTNGWNINGLSTTNYGTTTGVGSGEGDRFPSYLCPAGSSITGMDVKQTHSPLTMTVNGIEIPNTPVEVAPVA